MKRHAFEPGGARGRCARCDAPRREHPEKAPARLTRKSAAKPSRAKPSRRPKAAPAKPTRPKVAPARRKPARAKPGAGKGPRAVDAKRGRKKALAKRTVPPRGYAAAKTKAKRAAKPKATSKPKRAAKPKATSKPKRAAKPKAKPKAKPRATPKPKPKARAAKPKATAKPKPKARAAKPKATAKPKPRARKPTRVSDELAKIRALLEAAEKRAREAEKRARQAEKRAELMEFAAEARKPRPTPPAVPSVPEAAPIPAGRVLFLHPTLPTRAEQVDALRQAREEESAGYRVESVRFVHDPSEPDGEAPDGRIYRFHIIEGVREDGEPVRAMRVDDRFVWSDRFETLSTDEANETRLDREDMKLSAAALLQGGVYAEVGWGLPVRTKTPKTKTSAAKTRAAKTPTARRKTRTP